MPKKAPAPPACFVRKDAFYFNKLCAEYLFGRRRIKVSVAGKYIIFRPTPLSDGYKIRMERHGGAVISCQSILQITRVKYGKYRLYPYKEGLIMDMTEKEEKWEEDDESAESLPE